MIEEDYGITPDFKDSILRGFNEELVKLKLDLNAKVKRLSQSFRNELESMRRIVAKKNAEITRVALVEQARHEEALAGLQCLSADRENQIVLSYQRW